MKGALAYMRELDPTAMGHYCNGRQAITASRDKVVPLSS